EDRRLRILVDSDDGLGGLHPGAVLDGPGDAQRHVELRGHGLAGLPDLELVRVVTGIDGRPGGADRGTERVCELLDDREIVRRANTATSGDHHAGFGELRAVAAL